MYILLTKQSHHFSQAKIIYQGACLTSPFAFAVLAAAKLTEESLEEHHCDCALDYEPVCDDKNNTHRNPCIAKCL